MNVGKKTSKEKMLEKMTAISPAMQAKPTNSGYCSLRWERRIVDGEKKIFLSIDDDNYTAEPKPRKEYTDKEEFKNVVSKRVDDWIKDAG